MDPNATLRDIVDAHDDGDLDMLCDRILALWNWVQHDGFAPDFTTDTGRKALCILCRWANMGVVGDSC